MKLLLLSENRDGPLSLLSKRKNRVLTASLITFGFKGFMSAYCLEHLGAHVLYLSPCAAVPVWAAEPAGERPAGGGGARQAVQQHPGDRSPAHVPVEPGHASGPGQGQAGPGRAQPHRPAPRLQDGQSESHFKTKNNQIPRLIRHLTS